MDGNTLMKRDKEMDKKNKSESPSQFSHTICSVCPVITSNNKLPQISQIKKAEFLHTALVHNTLNRQGDIMWPHRIKIGRHIFSSKPENP